MKRISLLLTLGLLLAASELAVDEAEAKEGFVSLFNGKDFTGWRFDKGSALESLPANWKVEDGVIKLSGGGKPHLGSQWDYEDFDVRFQWRSVKDSYNSGFFIRSGRMVGSNQINLAKGAPGGFLGGKITGARPVPELQQPPRQWNDWRVLAEGDTVTFWCNGKLAWKGTGLAAKKGYLGLQAEGAPMEFRNIRLRELGYVPLNDLAQWKQSGAWKASDEGLTSDGKPALLELRSPPMPPVVFRLEWKGGTGMKAHVELSDGKEARILRVPLGDLAAGKTQAAVNPAWQWNYLELSTGAGKPAAWLNGTTVPITPTETMTPPPARLRILVEAGSVQLRHLRSKATQP